MAEQDTPFEPGEIAVVAIGRNEGQRMVACLKAALQQTRQVVYVDSGSTDGSLERAREMGVVVVSLDNSAPFTAARARNQGLARVREAMPQVELIQFLDADCEMLPGWLASAATRLREDSTLAGVAGVLRERYPEASAYNKLCDMEWQAPAGDTAAVGGNAMFRVRALDEVGGYDAALIAGEEPEMCVRLRQKGWRLWRLDVPMAIHDAAMTRFAQWWKRAVRFGYAQAQVSQMHKGSPQRIWARQTRSTVLYALVPPLASLVAIGTLATFMGGWWWLLGVAPLVMYDLLALRIFLSRRRMGNSVRDALLYSVATTVAKFPQFLGVLRYLQDRQLGRRAGIMEYKEPALGRSRDDDRLRL